MARVAFEGFLQIAAGLGSFADAAMQRYLDRFGRALGVVINIP